MMLPSVCADALGQTTPYQPSEFPRSSRSPRSATHARTSSSPSSSKPTGRIVAVSATPGTTPSAEQISASEYSRPCVNSTSTDAKPFFWLIEPGNRKFRTGLQAPGSV